MPLSELLVKIINPETFPKEAMTLLKRLQKIHSDDSYKAYLLGIIIYTTTKKQALDKRLQKEVNIFMRKNKLYDYYTGKKKPPLSVTTGICYFVVIVCFILLILVTGNSDLTEGILYIFASPSNSSGGRRSIGQFFLLIPFLCLLNILHDLKKRKLRHQIVSWSTAHA